MDLANARCVEKLSEFIEPTDTLVFLSAKLPAGGQTISSLMGNLTMAENIAQFLSEKRVNHFVYLSSEAVYDAERIPMDEDSSREPVSLYALMHTAREMMLDEICSKQNIPLIRLRPSYVYGPGHAHNNYGPNSFIRSALQNQEIKLYGKGEERRNFLFIEDLAEILVGVIKEKKRRCFKCRYRRLIVLFRSRKMHHKKLRQAYPNCFRTKENQDGSSTL